jgi:hypothetical protein
MPTLYISTSNGIYQMDEEERKPTLIFSKKWGALSPKKTAGRFFGICHDPDSNNIIFTTRERFRLFKYNKPTTHARLYEMNPTTHEYKTIGTISDIHDVHQIDCVKNCVITTDTGKNRLLVFDKSRKKVVQKIQLGRKRADIHHINALLIKDNKLKIGLNNRGNNDSQILTLDLSLINNGDKKFDAFEKGELFTIDGVVHSHDLEVCHNKILCCSSKEGTVVNTNSSEILIEQDKWARGLTCTKNYLWLGESVYAKRSERHKTNLSGAIKKYSLDDFTLLESITMEGAGQVNDIIHLPR